MLPKKHRLSKTADVTLTTAKGRSFFNPYFVIKSLLRKTVQQPMWTVVVSTKVSKQAVVRNRLKRLAREVIHKNLAGMKPGFYVLIVKRSAALIESSEFRNQIYNALKKSKILV